MSLKSLVNNPDIYEAFQEHLDERIKSAHSAFEAAQTTETMYRLQGQLYILRKLKMLREEVNKKDK